MEVRVYGLGSGWLQGLGIPRIGVLNGDCYILEYAKL